MEVSHCRILTTYLYNFSPISKKKIKTIFNRITFFFWAYYSLRKSSSDLSCKSFTEIVGSGTVKKPLFVSSSGVKKILDRKLQKAALDGNSSQTNKSTFKLIREASILSINT